MSIRANVGRSGEHNAVQRPEKPNFIREAVAFVDAADQPLAAEDVRGAQIGDMLGLCGSARRAMAAGHRSGQGEAFYWRQSIVCTMFAVYGLPPPVT